MRILRDWYILLVVSVVTPILAWAFIWLLRYMLVPGLLFEVSLLSRPLAVLIIGGPIYLGHWAWWMVICRREVDQQTDTSYYFFLFGTMGLFLVMIVTQLHAFFYRCLNLLMGKSSFYYEILKEPAETFLYYAIALLILGAVWSYHRWLMKPTAQYHENAVPARSLYLFGLAGLGWLMLTDVGYRLVRLVLGYDELLFRYDTYREFAEVTLINYLPGAVIGGGLWLVYWFSARAWSSQKHTEAFVLFLRQLYLYSILFVAMMGTVGSAAAMLAGVFRRLLDLPSSGDVRDALTIILVLGVWWVYHAYELQQDEKRARQATTNVLVPTGIQRLYLYMVASVGLVALLIGLVGVVHVFLDILDTGHLSDSVQRTLANHSAIMLAGFPVWLLSWQLVSGHARSSQVDGIAERQSFLRKMYLYAYLFLAAMAVLSSATYVVFRLLDTLLGGGRGSSLLSYVVIILSGGEMGSSLLSNVAEAIAYGVIGLGLWLYHWHWLRQDGRFAAAQEQTQMQPLQVLILGQGDTSLEHHLIKKMEQALPQCHLIYFDLTAAAVEGSLSTSQQFVGIDLIIGCWPLTLAGKEAMPLIDEVTALVVSSAVPKIMIPHQVSGWDWTGPISDGDTMVIESVLDKVKKLSLRQPA